MSLLTQTKFSFVSTALSSDTFAVVNFKGFEALSKPYDFDVMLVSENGDISLSDVLQKPATFTIHRDAGDDVVYHGIVAQFEQHQEFNNCYFYRARLVPKLWWLSLTFHNQIFLDKTIQEIIELVLKDAGLTSLDYDFKVQGSYSKIDYVCQYGESHLNFISRWIEREGLYYYFEQNATSEKVIFTDSKLAHGSPPQGDKLFYAPPSGLDSLHRLEVIKFFTCRQKLLPQKIFLKDYNYEKPSLEVTGSAQVDSQGRGEVYYYGEHFKTPQDGSRLAKIRAEEMLCRKEEYIGESTVPYIQPGYTFELQDHYRQTINQQYLTISNTFEGSQTGYLISGLKQALADLEQQVYFLNHFTAIPAAVQFRTERLTQKVKIQGTVQAKVDAGGSGQYAEIDDMGRYKVKMPFDQSGLKDGKASIWLRMVQPYAGAGMGMHFPLHKGTEVMIAFNEGDPDRPIIAGAVPNPETASPVAGGNQSQCVIQTGGQSRIAIEDQAGSEQITVSTPHSTSKIIMGATGSPAGIRTTTEDTGVIHAGNGIYLNAWPGDYWMTDQVGTIANVALAAAKIIGGLSVSAGAGNLSLIGGIAGITAGVSSFMQKGIILSSPNNIACLTTAKYAAIGLEGVDLFTPGWINILGVLATNIMSRGGISIYTAAGGIKSIASAGDVRLGAKTGNIIGTANKSLVLTAETLKILISARKDTTVIANEGKATLWAKKQDVIITGHENVKVKTDKTNIELTGKKKIIVDAGDEMVLKCGQASITLKKNGQIDIKGTTINVIASTGDLSLEGLNFKLKGKTGGKIEAPLVEIN